MLAYEYHVYGMRLLTNWRIPWLPFAVSPSTIDPAATLTIIASQRSKVGVSEIAISEVRFDGAPPSHSVTISDGVVVHYDSSLRNLHIEYTPQRTLDEVNALLFGPLMGYLLRGYGRLCLHASGVALGAQAILFVGPSGRGKSTLAATFAQRGYAPLTDDIAVLDAVGEEIFVQTGPQFLRLCQDTAGALFDGHGWGRNLTPSPLPDEKVYLTFSESTLAKTPLSDAPLSETLGTRTPLPLAAIYLLSEQRAGDAPRIEPLSSTQAFVLLAQNRFVRWTNAPLLHNDFATLRLVVDKTPVRMLYRPDSLAQLEQTFQSILADASMVHGLA